MDEQEEGGLPLILLVALIPLAACAVAFLAGVILTSLALI